MAMKIIALLTLALVVLLGCRGALALFRQEDTMEGTVFAFAAGALTGVGATVLVAALTVTAGG